MPSANVYAGLSAEVLNQFAKMDAELSKTRSNRKPMPLAEALEKINGRALEQENGDLKYRPILLPLQIGSQWFTVLLDSGAGCSLCDERLIDTFFANGLLWGVWDTLIPHEWGGLTSESTETGH